MRFLALLAALPWFVQTTLAQITPQQQMARDIFKQLIEINTSDSVGDNTRAAEAMAARFREAGYAAGDMHLEGPAPRKGNLVLRLKGTGPSRPILFIGHLDVVEAKRADWSIDPFVFLERDGFFYGRGTQDMKGDDATLVAAFVRMKREGFRPSRDLILALTSDEEGGASNGMNWLVKNHRDWIDAEYAINADAGGGDLKNGKRMYMGVQAAEKVFLTFKLEAKDPGGHSSMPRKDNPIYHLAGGLTRLGAYDFPVHLFDVTRAYFERMSTVFTGQVAADMKSVGQTGTNAAAVSRLSETPFYNALLRTTCVATMLNGGHAENALPQSATAVVNCRLLPVDKAEEIEQTLVKVLADPKIEISVMTAAQPSQFAAMNPQVLRTVTAVTDKYWPGLKVIPNMSTGATDGVYLRGAGIPTYGVGGIFSDEDDIRAHGRDERILVKSFDEAVPFMYDVVTGLAK